MKTVTFDKNKLLNMSKAGLEYVDDQGCRCAIDFHTCRENFQKETHLPEWLWANDPNYVGFRDIDAKPPYITLATNPPTRFVFPMSGPSVNDFHEFQMRLFKEARVKTFDRT